MSTEQQTSIEVSKMQRVINCLALELHESIWKDVNAKWQELLKTIQSNTINEPIKLKEDGSLSKVKVDYYEDRIEGLIRLLSEKDDEIEKFNEPIKDEELETNYDDIVKGLQEEVRIYCHENKELNKEVESLRKYAASQVNNTVEDKWISVEDRLPSYGQSVITYPPINVLPFGNSENELEGDNTDTTFWKWDSEYEEPKIVFGITHWQPLPKNPINNSKQVTNIK